MTKQSQISNEDNSEEDQNTVFVSGLPYLATEADVREFFKGCGTILQIKLPKYQDTQRLLGYGHITFDSSESKAQALRKDKDILMNRYIDVYPSKGEKPQSKRPDLTKLDKSIRRIFVKNLIYTLTEDQLGDFFADCGEIENIRFVYNSYHRHFKGFGYVDFKEHQGVVNALKKTGMNFMGRNIYIDAETRNPKLGFRVNQQTEGNMNYPQSVEGLKEMKTVTVEKIKSIRKPKNETLQQEEIKKTNKKLKLFS